MTKLGTVCIKALDAEYLFIMSVGENKVPKPKQVKVKAPKSARNKPVVKKVKAPKKSAANSITEPAAGTADPKPLHTAPGLAQAPIATQSRAGNPTTSPTARVRPQKAPKPPKAAKSAKPKGDSRIEAVDLSGQPTAFIKAAHPKQAVITGLSFAGLAAAMGRSAKEVLIVGLAVLVGQVINGLGNDVTDRARDQLVEVPNKPIASGKLPANNATFLIACLVLLMIPLAFQNGLYAGIALLITLPIGYLYNKFLRKTWLSFLPWALSGIALTAFLSLGGWGLAFHGNRPNYWLLAAAAGAAIGIHFLTSLPDLIPDNRAGVKHLPLRLGLKFGAAKVFYGAIAFTTLAVLAILILAFTQGLRMLPLN